jgi:hypothetical protein
LSSLKGIKIRGLVTFFFCTFYRNGWPRICGGLCIGLLAGWLFR